MANITKGRERGFWARGKRERRAQNPISLLFRTLATWAGRRQEDLDDSIRLDITTPKSLTFPRPVFLSGVFIYVGVGHPLAVLTAVVHSCYQLLRWRALITINILFLVAVVAYF